MNIVKREALPWYKSWLIRIISVILSLLVSALLTVVLTGKDPIKVYEMMIVGNFGSSTRVWSMLQGMAMLLGVALAITPAFKMKFWNIGAEGQVLIGALATTACMILIGNRLPTPLLILVMIVSSIFAGAIWGIIPAFFKAHWGTNETLFTLMMNYVAAQLVGYYCMRWENPKGSGTIGIINASSHVGWLTKIGGNDYLLNIIVVGILTVVMYVYLNYSKHGYELAVVGESENTAKYIGINVKKVIIRTMALSGAICGIVGLLLVAGTNHTLASTISGGRGFTAIMVSWMAKFNPLYMILTSFLLVFFEKGAGEISTVFGLNQSYSDIITGIVLFFIIGSEFFINYEMKFHHKNKEEK